AGGFAATKPTGSPSFSAGSLVLADYNGDGLPDLVDIVRADQDTVVSADVSGRVFISAGGSAGYSLSNARALAVADFNGDGVLDIAATSSPGSTVTVFFGNGAGQRTFAAGNVPQSIATGDFNHDGKPDLAVANWGDSTVSVLLGDGAGGFTP